MKYLLILLTLCSSLSLAQSTINGSFTHGGINRTFSFYVPASYSASTPVPLVLNLHGYTSNGTQQSLYTNFQPIADTANFIIVHPNGTNDPVGNQPFWNYNIWGATVDDLGFLQALIDTISAHYSINQDRIYSVGMSNGGYMSYYLACNTNRFAAVGSVTGSMSIDMYNNCNSMLPVPIIDIHGTADPTVPYNGNVTSKPIEDVVDFWVARNNCSTTPTVTAIPDNNTTDGATAEHYVYAGGIDNHTVEFFKITNGGHTWPGATVPLPGNGNTCMDFSASKEIWRFFSQYQRSEEAKINPVVKLEVGVAPNPATNSLAIQSGFPITGYSILDLQGRIVQSEATTISTNIDIQHLKNGSYLLYLKRNQQQFIVRFEKINQ